MIRDELAAMSTGRRETSNERRRRLLVYRSGQPEAAGSATDRRQLDEFRQARRPVAGYSTHVRRRLRGRWYSLVPVRRRSMLLLATAVMSVAVALCVAHWMAVLWPPLVARAELARPLRLDRPDSFGSWLRAALFAGSAVLSLLIYQLRRYRNDDYLGSYRIWPPLIVLMLVASIDSVCRLVPWIGSILEWSTGDGSLMAGSDWVRIVITIGGMALALRVVAEVWRSPVAMPLMTLAIVGLALPTAARWGIVGTGTRFRWLILTSAPTVGAAALWLSCVAYLRMLFREVRHLDHDTIASRVRRWRDQSEQAKQQRREARQEARDQLIAAKAAAKAEQLAAKQTVQAQRQADKDAAQQQRDAAVAQRAADKAQLATDKAAAKEQKAADKAAAREPQAKPGGEAPPRKAAAPLPAVAVGKTPAAEVADSADTAAKPPRNWRFWKRKPKDVAAEADPSGDQPRDSRPAATAAVSAPAAEDSEPKPARNWKFWKRKPKAEVVGDTQTPAVRPTATRSVPQPSSENAADGASADDAPAASKRGLGGWFSKLKRKPAAATDDGEGEGGDDGVDWSSMDKAERRRMRREMKRGGNAA